MSMELYAAVAVIPSRQAWQAAVDGLGFPLRLDIERTTVPSGCEPMTIDGRNGGVEISVAPIDDEWLETVPEFRDAAAGRTVMVTFYWGGSMLEAACACALAAALIAGSEAVAYMEEVHTAPDALLAEARALLAQA